MVSPLLSGLLHRWPLTEASGTRSDTVGSLHLAATGTVPQATGYVGPSPQAASFPATMTDYLSLPYNASNDLRFDTTFSLSLWFYQATATAQGTIASQQLYTTNTNLVLQAQSTNFLFGLDFTDATRMLANGGALNGAGWYFISVRHDAAAKKMTLFTYDVTRGTQTYAEKIYTATLTRATSPFRINGNSSGNSSVTYPKEQLVQEVGYWNRFYSDDEQLALLNGGLGDIYPYTTAYPEAGNIPTRDTMLRPGFTMTTPGNGFSASLSTETSRVAITPQKNVSVPQFEWINGQAAIATGEQTGLDSTSGGIITIIGATYYIANRMSAPAPLSFGGSPGTTVAYGERLLSDPLPIDLYSGGQVFINTYYSLAGGQTKVPSRMQIGLNMGLAGGLDKRDSITASDFTAVGGVSYIFAPSTVRGLNIGPLALKDRTVALRGDSIAPLYQLLINAANVRSDTVNLPGEAFYHLTPNANRDTYRTLLTRDNDRIVSEYGTNDCRLGIRSYAQLKADAATMWQRWLSGGAKGRSMLVPTLLPMTESGGSGSTSPAALSRGPWNTFLRSGATNQDISDMTGRPTLVYRWNGTSFVSSGARGAGSGAPLDFYVLDMAAVFETDHVANSNTWNTVTATGKIVVSAGTISDGIHPNGTDSAAARVVAQPQFDAWIAASLPQSRLLPLIRNRNFNGGFSAF